MTDALIEFGFNGLVTTMWQCIVVVAVARLLGVGRSASGRSALWSAALLVMLAMPVATTALPHYVFAVGGPRIEDAMARATWFSWKGWIVIAWGTVALMCAVRVALSWLAALRLVQLSRPIGGSRITDGVLHGRNVELRCLDGLLSPFCWQFRRTILVLPSETLQLSSEHVIAILRHELAHIDRQDPFGVFVQRLAEVVFWYHPAVWYASRACERDREFACDDAVIAEGESPLRYADCLRSVLRLQDRSFAAEPAVAALLGRRRMIVERLERLAAATSNACIERRRDRLSARLAVLLAAGVLVALVRVGPSPLRSGSGWTVWPKLSARCLQVVGINVRDFELDSHRRMVHERAPQHVESQRRRVREAALSQ